MDYFARKPKTSHPRDRFGIISKLFFLDALVIFKKGNKQELQEDHLYDVRSSLKSEKLGDELQESIERQKRRLGRVSIVKLLIKNYGLYFMLLGIIQLTQDIVIVVIEPYTLEKIIAYFGHNQDLTKMDAYFYAFIMIVFSASLCVCRNNYQFASETFSIRVRTAISSVFYRKLLKIKIENNDDISFGKILTIITKDIYTFSNFIYSAHDSYVSIIKLAVIGVLLYLKIGDPALAGVGYLLIAIPVQILLGWKMKGLKNDLFKKTDERLHQMEETLSFMKIIKMYCWENFFTSKIHSLRRKELQINYKTFMMRFIVLTIGNLHSSMAFYVLLMSYLWYGNTITADILYYIQNMFFTLWGTMSYFFPLAIYHGAELAAALKRIEDILNMEEVKPKKPSQFSEPAVVIDGLTIANDKTTLLINDFSIEFKKGLNFVTGPIGSGKTLLLKAILNSSSKEDKVKVLGKVAYAPQEPWLFPSTVRQNILFAEKYEPVRYRKVLEICALVHDLEQMPDGDKTIVEDQGLNLSKGQQARINLARAVYSKSDIYLLDDCLSALDARVRRHVFQDCLKTFLQDKITIFVTHDHEFMEDVDHIINLNGLSSNIIPQCKEGNNENQQQNHLSVDETLKDEEETLIAHENDGHIYAEFQRLGSVDINTYIKYFKYAGGYFALIATVILFLLSQGSISYNDKLLSNWVNFEENQTNASTLSAEEIQTERSNLSTIYSVVTVIGAITTFGKAMTLFFMTHKSSMTIHKKATKAIINAPMNYFDKNFTGNIMNRFSNDVRTVDEDLPIDVYYFLHEILIFFGAIALIVSVNAYFLILVAVFCVLVFFLTKFCIRSTRSLKRLESTTRSPVIGYLNATLKGITIIRVFGAESKLQTEFDQHQDLHTSAHYIYTSSIRALVYILEITTSVFIAMVVVNFLFFEDVAGNVGLALSQSFMLMATLQDTFISWTFIETEATSVERIMEYASVKSESKQGLELPDWPKSGEIMYKKVSLCYREHIKILDDVNVTINSKERVGIIGRTGAGKSTIISTLFQLYDYEGDIFIDGVNTKTLSIDFLRKSIAIIPQEPILFEGTLRENLDPYREKNDEEIWTAIETFNLKSLITSLDLQITDHQTFSLGQRQLICLARALLKQTKIIVLDEATSNMDRDTYTLIDEKIKKHFAHCTILIIAHNLQMVMKMCDQVIVMEKGRIVESGNPRDLLKVANGHLGNMLKSLSSDNI